MTLPAKILHVPSVHDSLVLLYSTAGLESNQDLNFRLGIQSVILQTNVNCSDLSQFEQIVLVISKSEIKRKRCKWKWIGKGIWTPVRGVRLQRANPYSIEFWREMIRIVLLQNQREKKIWFLPSIWRIRAKLICITLSQTKIYFFQISQQPLGIPMYKWNIK